MVYYNAPNFNPNLVFEGVHNENVKHHKHLHDFPVYKIKSRYSNPKLIQYDLQLERVGRVNNVNSLSLKDLQLSVRFSKNRAYVKINDPNNQNNQFEVPRISFLKIIDDLFDSNDLNLEHEDDIDDISQSNLGIRITNHPFGFAIYRKEIHGFPEEVLFDTIKLTESLEFDQHLFFAENYIQISTSLPKGNKGHFTYGLVIISKNKINTNRKKDILINSI